MSPRDRLVGIALSPLLLLLLASAGCGPAGDDAAAGGDLEQRARRLVTEVPLIDGHNDLPWQYRELAGGDVGKLDITIERDDTHTDIPRLRKGGVGAQFWSVYVPASLGADEAVTTTLEQVDVVHQMVRRHPDVFELCRTADDVERAFGNGRIGSLIGMEGGHSINSSLQVLRMFYRLGARYMTLTHSKNTPWADACTDEAVHNGLTAFGEEVVREMNRLGMLVDISHVSPDTMRRAIEVSAAPVIFSHSSARALTDSVRNVPDDVLRRLPEKDGLVMVTFVPSFVNEEVRIDSDKRRAERNRLREVHGEDREKINADLEAWKAANPVPRATLKDVADHIDHVRKIAGIDHVGLGGDFDGISSVPLGLEDVSKYIDLLVELMNRGYTDEEIRKLLGKNLLRVMRKVEEVAAGMTS